VWSKIRAGSSPAFGTNTFPGNMPDQEASGETLEQGTVKWYSPAKGYGFIVREKDQREIFVHHSAIVGEDAPVLWDGERVRFAVVQDPRGPQARQVTRLPS
jgi:cold shock protein